MPSRALNQPWGEKRVQACRNWEEGTWQGALTVHKFASKGHSSTHGCIMAVTYYGDALMEIGGNCLYLDMLRSRSE